MAVADYLYELTNAELEDVALSAGIQRLSFRRKDDLIENILEHRAGGEVAPVAEKVEALRGFKHVWLFHLGGADGALGMDRLAAALWPNAPGTHLQLDHTQDVLQPTLQFVDTWANAVYVKFTHWVQSDTWELVAPGLKELKSRRTRHPVVAVLHADTGLVEFRFGGYTQGMGTPKDKRLPYDELVARAARVVADKLERDIVGMGIADAISEMLEARPDEVLDVRRVVKPSFGGRLVLDASSAGTDMDVPMLMSRFFSGIAPTNITQLEEQIRRTLVSTPAETMLLAWSVTGIMTRVAFYEVGPELLFIWHGEEPTLEAISGVVSTMVSHMRLRSGGTKQALDNIRSASADIVVRATDLMYQFQLTSQEAYEVLEEARRRGFVERQFRIRTDKVLLEIPNAWRP